jgi:anhydro-N-acetylmuramic acid kinase
LFSLEYVLLAQQHSGTTSLSPEDLMATLTRFSAETIAEAILKVCKKEESYHLYLSGGGMHNPLIISALRELMPDYPMAVTDSLGISGDAKEAVLFAILANETLCGGLTDFGSREGVPSVSMGKISFPA